MITKRNRSLPGHRLQHEENESDRFVMYISIAKDNVRYLLRSKECMAMEIKQIVRPNKRIMIPL